MQEYETICPFCGEGFTILVDCSVTEQSYVEDCYVCCRPIQFAIQCSEDGEILTVHADRG